MAKLKVLDWEGVKELVTEIKSWLDAKANANHTHNYAGSNTAGGVANSATKLATARNIKVIGAASGSLQTAFDGTAEGKIDVHTLREPYLTWGGKNIAGDYSPIDAAMIGELGANRFAFMPEEAITFEYSRDGGSTWTLYEDYEKGSKTTIFNGNITSLVIGDTNDTGLDKSKYRLRITIDTKTAGLYTVLHKFVILCSTKGSTGCWCTITTRTLANCTNNVDSWKTYADKVKITGWSGHNVINLTEHIVTALQDNHTTHSREIRFTFGVDSHGTDVKYGGLTIHSIWGFGGVGWSTPSNMAKCGLIYNYDYNKNVSFPNRVISKGFIGNLEGNVNGVSNVAKTVQICSSGTDRYRPVPFSVSTTDVGTFSYHTNLQYNPATQMMTTNITGNAASATKLTTSAGNTKTPVYFKDGVPTALGYTIEKSVPADAVFTDTKYTLASFGITSSAAELNYCKGVTSNIQTQLNGKAASSHSHNYLPLSGGTLTGNLTGQYITGTWLQTTAAGEVATASKICVLDASGWVYYITPAKLLGSYTTKEYVDGLMTVNTTLEV